MNFLDDLEKDYVQLKKRRGRKFAIVERSGTVLVLAGAVGYGYLLAGAFAAR